MLTMSILQLICNEYFLTSLFLYKYHINEKNIWKKNDNSKSSPLHPTKPTT